MGEGLAALRYKGANKNEYPITTATYNSEADVDNLKPLYNSIASLPDVTLTLNISSDLQDRKYFFNNSPFYPPSYPVYFSMLNNNNNNINNLNDSFNDNNLNNNNNNIKNYNLNNNKNIENNKLNNNKLNYNKIIMEEGNVIEIEYLQVVRLIINNFNYVEHPLHLHVRFFLFF